MRIKLPPKVTIAGQNASMCSFFYETFDFSSITDLYLDECSMHDFRKYNKSLVSLRHLNVRGLSDSYYIFKIADYIQPAGLETLTISSQFIYEAPSMTELLLKANLTKCVNHTVIEISTIRRDLEFYQSRGENCNQSFQLKYDSRKLSVQEFERIAA